MYLLLFRKFVYQVYFRHLENSIGLASPSQYSRRTEGLVLTAFKSAWKRSPAYRDYLIRNGVKLNKIKCLKSFCTEVPVLTKEELFQHFDAQDIFPGIVKHHSGRIWLSSGTSGRYSFGFEKNSNSSLSLGNEFMLHYFLRILTRKSLFINCLPDFWPLPSRFSQFSNVGTRTDLAIALLRRFSKIYKQFIVCGEPLLLKKLVEEIKDDGFDLSKLSLHFILGGEYISHNLKQYILNSLNPLSESETQPVNMAFSTMGLSEFGLSVFFETPLVERLRDEANRNSELCSLLSQNQLFFVPQIFQYNPLCTYVEAIEGASGESCLVLTNLDSRAEVPLIRYNTRDIGYKYSFEEFNHLLSLHPSSHTRSFEFPFPFVVVSGRNPAIDLGDGSIISSCHAKEILYASHDLLPKITGYFIISPSDAGSPPTIRIQLKQAISTRDISRNIKDRIRKRFRSFSIKVKFAPYGSFLSAIGLLYNKKLCYIEKGPKTC